MPFMQSATVLITVFLSWDLLATARPSWQSKVDLEIRTALSSLSFIEPSLIEEAATFAYSLYSNLELREPEFPFVAVDSNHITITVPATHNVLFGTVCLTSHFPYDFYFWATKDTLDDLSVFKLTLIASSNLIRVATDTSLWVRYAPWRYQTEAERKAYARDFRNAFPASSRLSTAIMQGLESAKNNGHMEFNFIEFFRPHKTTLVQAEFEGSVKSQAGIDDLYGKLKYKIFARSSISFGCMVTHLQDPKLIPAAEAAAINRLFATQLGGGVGQYDGRVTWRRLNLDPETVVAQN